MSEKQKKKNHYAISGIFTKNISNGLNIRGNIEIVNADSIEEAIKAYELELNKKLPEHSLFQMPLAIDLADYGLNADQREKVIRLCDNVIASEDSECDNCQRNLAKQLKEELQG